MSLMTGPASGRQDKVTAHPARAAGVRLKGDTMPPYVAEIFKALGILLIAIGSL
jgi:hypothetical protein